MKYKAKRIIAILFFVLIFGFCVFGIFYLYISGRPTPATTEQVEAALNAQGFQSKNITDSAQDNFPGFGLESCIVAEQTIYALSFTGLIMLTAQKRCINKPTLKLLKTGQANGWNLRKEN